MMDNSIWGWNNLNIFACIGDFLKMEPPLRGLTFDHLIKKSEGV
jgi:hypothetical protein